MLSNFLIICIASSYVDAEGRGFPAVDVNIGIKTNILFYGPFQQTSIYVSVYDNIYTCTCMYKELHPPVYVYTVRFTCMQ